jgi:hypothetical protein
VYPERLLSTPQPPDGPRQWVCPLAVIDWSSSQIADCRQHFESLVALTQRRASCCTMSVAPSDLNGDRTLQSIIDDAVRLGPNAKVCLSPGTYLVSQSLRLTGRHSGLVIEACAGGVSIEAAADPVPGSFVDGVMVLTGAQNVTLRGLTLLSYAEPAAPAIPTAGQQVLLIEWTQWMTAATAQGILGDIGAMIGVHLVNSPGVSLDRCEFQFTQRASPSVFDLFGAGVLVHGDCAGLSISGCNFASQIAPTFTPQSPNIRRAATEAAAISTGAPARKVSAATRKASSRAQARAATGARAPVAATSVFATSPAAPATLVERLDAVLKVAQIGPLRLPIRFRTRAPVIATVGCLAAPYLSFDPEARLIPCNMGTMQVQNCTFNNLSSAVFAWADADTERFSGNQVTGCSLGLWINLTSSMSASPQIYWDDWNAATAFQEWIVAATLAFVYPPAAPSAQPSTTAFSLFVTDNQVEALLLAGSEQQTSAALVVLANRSTTVGQDVTTSLIITGNQIRSSNNRVPAAFLVVPDNQPRSVVQGNQIFNEAGVNGDSDSLHVIPNSEQMLRFAVTGNTFKGQSNLNTLQRPGIGAIPNDLPDLVNFLTAYLTTWQRWNS